MNKTREKIFTLQIVTISNNTACNIILLLKQQQMHHLKPQNNQSKFRKPLSSIKYHHHAGKYNANHWLLQQGLFPNLQANSFQFNAIELSSEDEEPMGSQDLSKNQQSLQPEVIIEKSLPQEDVLSTVPESLPVPTEKIAELPAEIDPPQLNEHSSSNIPQKIPDLPAEIDQAQSSSTSNNPIPDEQNGIETITIGPEQNEPTVSSEPVVNPSTVVQKEIIVIDDSGKGNHKRHV